ncbi:hypothetical protein GCM10017744_017680 [Streptomyces antimycoticus]
MRMGGAFELKQITWAFRHGEESPEAERDPLVRKAFARTDLRDWFTVLPWRTGVSRCVRWGVTSAICSTSGGMTPSGVLAPAGHLRARPLRPLPGCADPAHVELVRPVCALHHRELHRHGRLKRSRRIW